ncbi:MIR motif-containing protein [Phlyctochytrium arcticum]|nr:MIR motif-containing protein [Phlyctochytrium arcticum]
MKARNMHWFLWATVVAFLGSAAAKEQTPFVLDDEFRVVSCASVVKLAHKNTGCRLHSQQVSYGTGSGQQAVTCNPAADNNDDFFIVSAGHGQPQCQRGQPMKCKSIIRLVHLNSGKYLHSHSAHASPFSHNQEVSAFDGTDTGDNWVVICVEKGELDWNRESQVRLRHVDTNKYLAANPQFTYRINPAGQVEVSGVGSTGLETHWIAQEGLYFGSQD